jgi:hypothetical protein
VFDSHPQADRLDPLSKKEDDMRTPAMKLIKYFSALAILASLALPMQAGDHLTLGNKSRNRWKIKIEAGSVGKVVLTDLQVKTTQTLEKEADVAFALKDAKYDLDFQSPENGSYEVTFSLIDEEEVDSLVTWTVSGGKVSLRSNPLKLASAPLYVFAGKFLILTKDTWAHASLDERACAEAAAAEETGTETKQASKD